MESMTVALSAMELEFQKIIADLQFVKHRLDAEFEEGADESSINPMKIFRRVTNIQTELFSVKRRAEDAAATKLQLAAEMREYTEATHQNLTFLADRCGVDLPDVSEQLTAMRRVSDTLCTATGGVPFAAAAPPQAVPTAAAPPTEEPRKALAPLRVNANAPAADPFADIDEYTFEEVPPSIRGRCKLDTVNQAMRLVVGHFRKPAPGARKVKGRRNAGPPRPPLTIKDLDKMGAKVSGATGAAVINTLRHLGKVNVAKAGISLASGFASRR